MAGLDFMAIARGRRQAENENWEDFTRAQRAEDFAFQREQRDIKRQEQTWGREAAAWLAPSISNRQLAADAGISAIDYEIQQREQTLANPEFQAMSPEVQNLILQQMQQRALLAAQTARDQGDITAANRITQAYGQPRVLGAVQEAAYQGNVDEVLTRAGFPPDANGMVSIGGVLVPKITAAQQLIASGGVPGAVVTAAAQQAANEALASQQQTVAQQVASQQAVEVWTQARNAAQLAGILDQFLVLNPDPRSVPMPGVTATVDSSLPAATPMQQVAAAQQAAPPVLTAAQTAAVAAAPPAAAAVPASEAIVGAGLQALAAQQGASPTSAAQAVSPLGLGDTALRLLLNALSSSPSAPAAAPTAAPVPAAAASVLTQRNYEGNEARAIQAIPVHAALKAAGDEVLRLSREIQADRVATKRYQDRGGVGVNPSQRLLLNEARLREAMAVMQAAQVKARALPETVQGIAPTNFDYGPSRRLQDSPLMLRGVK